MALTDYVIMPGEDYQAICDAVREKRNETEVIKSGEIAGKIQGIETDPELQNKTIIPTTEQQIVTADEGYDGLGVVTVKAASMEVDPLVFLLGEYGYKKYKGEKHADGGVPNPSLAYAFAHCGTMVTPPLFDTSSVVSMEGMFLACNITSVPLYDTSSVKDMSYTFQACDMTSIPLFDTSSVIYAVGMFMYCRKLITVPALDMRNMTNSGNMFYSATSLTDCYLRNIKTSLQVGSGTSWGHLLTIESLIHLIQECRDTGSQKTLTVGSANLEKLANVYVRLIDITDEMRAEDDLIDEKYPFEVCESTDEGAMLITDYAAEKNWAIA